MNTKVCSKCLKEFIEDRSKWPIIMQLVNSQPPNPLCISCMEKGFKSFMENIEKKNLEK